MPRRQFLFLLLVISSETCFSSGKNKATIATDRAAEQIIANLDASEDPCYDFYNFACGGFVEASKLTGNANSTWIPPDRRVKEIMIDALLQSTDSGSEAVRKLKLVYHSCRDWEFSKSSKDIFAAIKNFGGFPMLEGEKWNESNFDLAKLLIESDRTRDVGAVTLGEPDNSVLYNAVPFKHPKRNQWGVYIGPPSVYGIRAEDIKDLLEVERLAQEGGFSLKPKVLDKELAEVVAFEKEIGKSTTYTFEQFMPIGELFEDHFAALENGSTLNDLKFKKIESFPGISFIRNAIDWETYFKFFASPKKLDLLKNTAAVYSSPKTLSQLYILWQAYGLYDARTMQNYVILRFLLRLKRNKLPGEFGRLWDCVEEASLMMPHASSALYAEATQNEDSLS